jgi:hypothetical protein
MQIRFRTGLGALVTVAVLAGVGIGATATAASAVGPASASSSSGASSTLTQNISVTCPTHDALVPANVEIQVQLNVPTEVAFGSTFEVSGSYTIIPALSSSLNGGSALNFTLTTGDGASYPVLNATGDDGGGTITTPHPIMALGAVGQTMHFNLTEFTTSWYFYAEPYNGSKVYHCTPAAPVQLGTVTVGPPASGATVNDNAAVEVVGADGKPIYVAGGIVSNGSFAVFGFNDPSPIVIGQGDVAGPLGTPAQLTILASSRAVPGPPPYNVPASLVHLSDPAAGINLSAVSGTPVRTSEDLPYFLWASGVAQAQLPTHQVVTIYWTFQPLTQF